MFETLVEKARAKSVHVSALEHPRVRDLVRRSDLVLGFDESQPGHCAIFFGRARLEEIANGGSGEVELRGCGLRYDSRTEGLEWLVAAIMRFKGSCDYEANV